MYYRFSLVYPLSYRFSWVYALYYRFPSVYPLYYRYCITIIVLPLLYYRFSSNGPLYLPFFLIELGVQQVVFCDSIKPFGRVGALKTFQGTESMAFASRTALCRKQCELFSTLTAPIVCDWGMESSFQQLRDHVRKDHTLRIWCPNIEYLPHCWFHSWFQRRMWSSAGFRPFYTRRQRKAIPFGGCG